MVRTYSFYLKDTHVNEKLSSKRAIRPVTRKWAVFSLRATRTIFPPNLLSLAILKNFYMKI
jgi:hypothetical protein